METFYNFHGTVEEAVEILRPHHWILNEIYKNSLEEETKLSKEYGFDSKPDTRSGEETYGYKSDEDILCNLFYISDRWGCAFRVRWILDLIDRYDENKNNSKDKKSFKKII